MPRSAQEQITRTGNGAPKNMNLPQRLAEQAASGPKALRHALEIWWAGVTAVTPDRLFATQVSVDGQCLRIGDEELDLNGIHRIVVVGAGKASAAMASALYTRCLSKLAPSIDVIGWINAPEGSFTEGSAGPIHLHVARPVGINEPTEQAVVGTEAIMQMVRQCGRNDLCIVLLSGGGSAILAAPIDGITLNDKQQVARRVAAAGANIQQLNTVRRALSRVKGGGLAVACNARRMVSLIISDVLGDPLETIASGPTVSTASASPLQALEVLEHLHLLNDVDLKNVVTVLRKRIERPFDRQMDRQLGLAVPNDHHSAPVTNIILANNATAVDAAGTRAVELGYRYIMQSSRSLEGDVSELAIAIGNSLEHWSAQPQVDCWISGGEPVVKLPSPERCGKGGRNQQLALLSMIELSRRGWPIDQNKFPQPLLFLSAGTDGEDGPTLAAGAWFNRQLFEQSQALGLDLSDFAQSADAFSLFERLDGLIISGPSGTNVCDLRIAIKT